MSGVAVVTIAQGRHDHLHRQHWTLARSPTRPELYVVVAMSDPGLVDLPPVDGLAACVVEVEADPRGLPLAAARNRGMELARRAGCDVLIGLDVDCLAGAGLVAGYAEAVRHDRGALWSGPVTYLDPPGAGGYALDRLDTLEALDDPHPARPAPAPGDTLRSAEPDLFWSLSYATSPESWARIGGFDEAYVGYGAEDTDFAQRAVRAGVGLAWSGSARAYHQHHPVHRPPVEHLDDILRNGRVFHARWGRWPMQGWLAAFEEMGLVTQHGDRWVRCPR